jgi:hypothetical protein
MKSLPRKNLNLLLDLEEEIARTIPAEEKTKRLKTALKKLYTLNRAAMHEQELGKPQQSS